jgi:outer membrane cobalamin receptor
VGLDNQFDLSKVRVNLPNSYDLGGVQNPFGVGDERKFDTEDKEALLGAYLRHEYRPSETGPWTLLPNLRLDHFSNTHETFVQPRFQTRYQISPSTEWHTAIGRYVQPPRPQESSPDYGNGDLRSPESIHYMVGWGRDFRENGTQGLQFTNNYFYKTLDSLVIPSIADNYSNDGEGTILGGELQAKYQRGPWNGQVVYTYLNSKRSIPGQGEYPAEFDQTHNLNLILARQYERWNFSGRFRVVSGAPYTPVSGASYDADNDVYIPIRGSLYARRFPTFHQLDLRAERKTIYDQWILSWYVDVQNVMNTPNASAVEYSYDYRQKKNRRGLPILPTFGVRGEF